MKNIIFTLAFYCTCLSLTAQNNVSLAGDWRFQTDAADKGVSELVKYEKSGWWSFRPHLEF